VHIGRFDDNRQTSGRKAALHLRKDPMAGEKRW
jgi:hypothetical protein